METAVKLLTFSWVVYGVMTPPAAEKDVHILISSLKSKSIEGDEAVQSGETKAVQQVSASCSAPKQR